MRAARRQPEGTRDPASGAGSLATHDLVLLHGQPGLGADWDGVIAALPDRIRVLAPDRPGYGSSTRPGSGYLDNARAVVDELDAHGIKRAVIGGHSYGGGVAVAAAALAPERVEALVLLASVGPGCVTGWDWPFAAPGTGPALAVLSWQLTPWLARSWLRAMARVSGRTQAQIARQHPNVHAWGWARWDHGPLWRSVLAEQRAVLRESDGLALLAPSVRVPALIAADPADSLVPIRTARELQRLLPDSRLSLIDGAGHHLPLRMPEQVADLMTGFIDSLAGSGRSEGPRGSAVRPFASED